MLSVQMEQRANLKFLFKLGKTFTEAYKCTGMNVYHAHTFLNGLNGLKRDVKRPKTIRAPDGPQRQKRTNTLKKIGKLIREDCRLSIRWLAEITVLRKVCAKMVPKLLTPERKE
ncbi:hypothetical protein NQ318_006533 [Aromia moschata]|uniref:Transposase n=1 Tax=Aromia moschata TaxID=1265417 RepID=A0AAV8YQA1_9CUCU|nr:hypothetical protein NQ318_006533 [Aromia moschata]